MAKTKYVTIESYGNIPGLGGLLGPITTPTHIDIDIIIALINGGKVVYEVNPRNVKEKIRLTRTNVLSNNFDTNVKKVTTNAIKAKDIGLTQTTVKPSSVNTSITTGSNTGMIGADIFLSNKYS